MVKNGYLKSFSYFLAMYPDFFEKNPPLFENYLNRPPTPWIEEMKKLWAQAHALGLARRSPPPASLAAHPGARATGPVRGEDASWRREG